jgi:hypothetical protein
VFTKGGVTACVHEEEGDRRCSRRGGLPQVFTKGGVAACVHEGGGG